MAFAEMKVVTQTYDIPAVACDGLNLEGVGYVFTIGPAPSADCTAGTLAGPGVTNHISRPNIEGSASGVLHLTFFVPTTKFSFGVAQSTTSLTQEVIINLNRPGVGLLRESITLITTADPIFVGARYEYDGPAVKTVTISFSNIGGRFAIDNVTYFRPPGQDKK
jgi:hypothetical protein